jgi:GT2 family glycosyltransferase
MSSLVDVRAVVIVPNWNGVADLAECLDSLIAQTLKPHIIVVDNGSTDGSVELVESHYPGVELIKHSKNRGYAGGVNPGFQRAIESGVDYAAPFNNDAVADKQWLEQLVKHLDKHPHVGIAACKLLNADGTALDSTGDYYTVWGLPYPRGRGETNLDKYDHQTEIFAASGGASLYRVSMLEQIGLLDEDFFAYYEDVDLSFRAQLAGYKVAYVPAAKAYHQISATSSRIKGFATYQTLKNLPILLMKNVPRKYLWRVNWRYKLAQALFFGRAVLRGHGWSALKGKARCVWLLPGTLRKRRQIQASKTVSDEYIWNLLVHDLPPNAQALRRLRRRWWRLRGKKT